MPGSKTDGIIICKISRRIPRRAEKGNGNKLIRCFRSGGPIKNDSNGYRRTCHGSSGARRHDMIELQEIINGVGAGKRDDKGVGSVVKANVFCDVLGCCYLHRDDCVPRD